MTPASHLPGWFGKLPALGDFAHRRLTPSFIERWDPWLQACLDAHREQDWAIDGEPPAPPLRFWLAPAICDRYAWCGILAPSVDRVGRRFPLTIASVTPIAIVGSASADQTWFEAIESHARRAIAGRLSVEAFERELETVPAVSWHPPLGASGSLWWTRHTCGAPRPFAGLPPIDAFASLVGVDDS